MEKLEIFEELQKIKKEIETFEEFEILYNKFYPDNGIYIIDDMRDIISNRKRTMINRKNILKKMFLT